MKVTKKHIKETEELLKDFCINKGKKKVLIPNFSSVTELENWRKSIIDKHLANS